MLAFDLFLPPGGHVPAQHAHPIQEERFTVVEGELEFRVGRRNIHASPGETIVVPPRTTHWFGNRGATPAHARVEVRPALRMEELLARSEQFGRSPGARLSQLALVLLEFRRELAVPFVPEGLVRLALAPFALWRRAHAHS